MQRHSCGSKVAMMVGSCLYSVVVGLLRHLLIATTQLSELEGASTDAQSPSVTLLLLLQRIINLFLYLGSGSTLVRGSKMYLAPYVSIYVILPRSLTPSVVKT